MKKIFVAFSAIFLIFLSSPTIANCMANEVTESGEVRKFVEDIGNKIVNIANQKISESKKRSDIIAVIDGAIDAEWIARFVLAKNYKTANDSQKESFVKLYRDFMINTYGPKFKNYNGRKFTVNSVEYQTGFYLAKAEFLPKESDVAISVDFRVKKRNGKLVILDFIAEGISLIETQRSEFNSVIAQKGMDEFLEELTKRVKKLKSSN
jgi:phospholipid transport system substrate-binding protein